VNLLSQWVSQHYCRRSCLRGSSLLASRRDAGRSSCNSGLAVLAARPACWPDERWRSLAESAAVLLLVDSLLRCSPDASIVVTDASVSEVRIFILLSLGGARTNGCWSCHGEH
jgi:hypothetical protein